MEDHTYIVPLQMSRVTVFVMTTKNVHGHDFIRISFAIRSTIYCIVKVQPVEFNS